MRVLREIDALAAGAAQTATTALITTEQKAAALCFCTPEGIVQNRATMPTSDGCPNSHAAKDNVNTWIE